jgi:hypothetical protein
MSNHIHEDELIFHKVGDEIISAGFGINSVLLNRGLPPILSFLKGHTDLSSSSSDSDDEEKVKEDKSVFKSFKNLAVPLGLFTSDKYKQRQHDEHEHNNKGAIPDDLFDKLLNLVDSDVSPEVVAHTTKKNSKKHKQTTRNAKSKRKHKHKK